VLLVLAGCGGLGQAVKVQRTDEEPAEPRPKGCAVELLYRAPARPYRELAELTAKVVKAPGDDALEVLKDPACELGADAVIVTRKNPANHFDQVFVSGTAIKYVGARPAPAEIGPGAVPDSVAL
jgi:hypothetical protein